MTITDAIRSLSAQFDINPSLMVETAQDEESIKKAIIGYSKGEFDLDAVTYIFNQVF